MLTDGVLSSAPWLQEPGQERAVHQQHLAGQVPPAAASSRPLTSAAKGQGQPSHAQYLCECRHRRRTSSEERQCHSDPPGETRINRSVLLRSACLLSVALFLLCPDLHLRLHLLPTAGKQARRLLPSTAPVLHQLCQPRHRHQRPCWSSQTRCVCVLRGVKNHLFN